MLQRLRSPRRLIATTLAIAFLLLYVLNGILILSARQPANPERLRLWLSGGMVLYGLYHLVRCVWTTRVADLELTEAEKLWLGGAPVQRSSLAVYHLGNVVFASGLKTLLLAVVLTRDVQHLELLIAGVFAALLLLEVMRLILQRWSAGLCQRVRLRMRVAATALAVAVVMQILCRVASMTALGSPTLEYVLNSLVALGETASCGAIQWLSIPWIAPASATVMDGYGWQTLTCLLITALTIPASIVLLVNVDAWADRKRLADEKQRLVEGSYQTNCECDGRSALSDDSGAAVHRLERLLPEYFAQVLSLTAGKASVCDAIGERSCSVSRSHCCFVCHRW